LPASVTEFQRLTALEDQQLGGTIMLLVGGAAYLAGGLWLMAKLLQHRNQEAAA
jgi:putative membrane protein